MTIIKKIIIALALLFALAFATWATSSDESLDINEEIQSEELEEVVEEDPIELLKADLISKIRTVVWSYTISEAIVVWCMNHTEDYILCMKHTVGVANAESSIFKNVWRKNNAFWITNRQCIWADCFYTLKSYTSIEESIIDFIRHYERNNWYKRVTGQDRLRWKYCTSSCTNRVPAFNKWVKKVEQVL